MKKILTILLPVVIATGCVSSQKATLSLELVAQLPITELQVRSTPLYPSEDQYSVTNKELIEAFCSGLCRCKPMSPIDSTGSHEIEVISTDDSRYILEAGTHHDWGFIRVSEYTGDKYFKCDKPMVSVLKQIGINDIVESKR